VTALFAGSMAARAVGRFDADGPAGCVAESAPSWSVAALRETRAEAEADELAWRAANQ